jgi:hypothetical protein
LYLTIESTVVLASGFQPRQGPTGIAWTAITAAAMSLSPGYPGSVGDTGEPAAGRPRHESVGHRP